MTDKTINQGGNTLFLVKNGLLRTVSANNTYRLSKAVELDFDLAPPFELKYDDDLGFDLTPSGDVGTWAAEMPVTSDMVSTSSSFSPVTEDDSQTLSYWANQLGNKKFPSIQFREIMTDTQSTAKTGTFNFKGYLTRLQKTREEGEGVYKVRLEGIIQEFTSFIKT